MSYDYQSEAANEVAGVISEFDSLLADFEEKDRIDDSTALLLAWLSLYDDNRSHTDKEINE